MITKKYYKLVKVSYEDSGYFYVKNVSDQNGTLTTAFNLTSGGSFEYSTDGVNWNSISDTTSFSLSVQSGNSVYLRGNTTKLTATSYVNGCIRMDVDHIVGGNPFSMLNKTNFNTMTTAPGGTYESGHLLYLFRGDTHLIDASQITFGNVVTLKTSTLSQMFYGCTGLINGPELNDFDGTYGTNQGSCNSMFQGCSHLTNVKIKTSVWDTGRYNNWLAGVSASGTIYAPTGSDIANYSGASGVPSGWTVVYY